MTVKFITVIDGVFMLYTKYSMGNCYAKHILKGTAKPISTEEFATIQEQAKTQGLPYEEVSYIA